MSDDSQARVLLDVRDADDGRIAYVTLNRGAKYNGLDPAMMRALVDVPKQIAADRTIRAVILAGDGPAFCAGLDFAAMGKAGPLAQVRGFVKLPGRTTNFFQRVCWAWRDLPVPVVAVVHGPCFGGGLQLALAADFRFATPDAQLSVMEAKWGLIPDMTGSVTLRELVPMDVAKRLAMTAEVLDGHQALDLGLVTGASDEPLKDAEALVGQLLTRSPDALAYTKRLFHRTWTRSPRWAFWTESVLQARLMTGVNHTIARKAGLAKQRPTWASRKVR
ncbi:crotonase/enoyl-CoA hydratase family protein [uncultured Jatrophihabitans sp.]|uniref:crotonase/enoyl-CoA hydratase family protein n=1 Tax=uncultured Jatrophihabitans sp. TaxID=1610747 RepID=UPI0035CC89F8